MNEHESAPFLSTLAHHAADPFRLLVESVVDYAIFMVDPSGNVASWNPGAERIYGYAAEEIIGRSVSIFMVPGPDNELPPEQVLASVVREGRSQMECLRVRKDGSQFWAVVTMTDLKGHFGQHIGFAKITRDVTERRHAEEKLRRERDLSASIIDSLPGIFYLYDEDRHFLRWNRLFESISGYSAAEMQCAHPLDFFGEQDQPLLRKKIANVFRAGYDEVEADFLSKSGQHTPFYFNGVRAELDGQRCLLGMGIDISQLRAAQQALRDSQTQLENFVRFAPAALAMFDHEMRYVAVSHHWLTTYGIIEQAVIGRSHYEVFPNLPPHWITAHQRGMAGEEVHADEDRFDHVDGSIRWVRWDVRPWHTPEGNIGGIVIFTEDITDQKNIERALRESEERLRLALDAAQLGIFDWDVPRNRITWSRRHEELWGYAPGEFPGTYAAFAERVHADDILEINVELERCQRAHERFAREFRVVWPDGSVHWVAGKGEFEFNSEGIAIRMRGVVMETTERKLLEHQLRHAQKMEDIGRLASGIAHDFNNLLTVISGSTELILSTQSPSTSQQELLVEIQQASDRAASLTRQLLAFSRQTVLHPRRLQLNDVLLGFENLLRRLIGDEITLQTVLDPALHVIKADAHQIGQVLMNLAVNARDAMDYGGILTFETRNIIERGQNPDGKPQRSVELLVSDTGCGMSPEILDHIFKPFFTTKDSGKGTGLGLSVVYGIIQQSGGTISVVSEPKVGTVFRIRFPALENQVADIAEELVTPRSIRSGSETILLVEDDAAVRRFIQSTLESNGYCVLPVSSGEEALHVAETHSGPIQLLITDVSLPGLIGPEIAAELTRRVAGMKVLFISSQSADILARIGIPHSGVAFLPKPFSSMELHHKIREVLDPDPK